MIDRSRLTFCLRGRTLGWAAALSAGLCALVPTICLLFFLVGVAGFVLCWLLKGLMGLLSYGLMLGGGFGILAAIGMDKSQEDKKVAAGCGGFFAIVIGIFFAGLFLPWHGPIAEASFRFVNACFARGEHVFKAGFLGSRIYLWSWCFLAASLSAALATLTTLLVLKSETPFKRVFRRIAYACPRCHARGLPLFRCPSCSALVEDLKPSVFGVFHARCAGCSAELVTTDAAGRLDKYHKVCREPECRFDLIDASFGRCSEYHFAVVGACGAGKTTLMVSALRQLETAFGPLNGLKILFGQPDQEQQYNNAVADLQRGRVLPRTPRTSPPTAFNVALDRSDGTRKLLYLHDASGADFERDGLALTAHRYTGFLDGIVLVLDPTTEENLAASVPEGAMDATDMLGRLLPYWESVLRVSSGGRIRVPLAVVLSKADATPDERLKTASNLEMTYPTLAEAANAAVQHGDSVRGFLDDHGMGNVVRLVEMSFKTVGWFAVSALGRSPGNDPSPFRPEGAVAPFVWLGQRSGAM